MLTLLKCIESTLDVVLKAIYKDNFSKSRSNILSYIVYSEHIDPEAIINEIRDSCKCNVSLVDSVDASNVVERVYIAYRNGEKVVIEIVNSRFCVSTKPTKRGFLTRCTEIRVYSTSIFKS